MTLISCSLSWAGFLLVSNFHTSGSLPRTQASSPSVQATSVRSRAPIRELAKQRSVSSLAAESVLWRKKKIRSKNELCVGPQHEFVMPGVGSGACGRFVRTVIMRGYAAAAFLSQVVRS